MTSTKKTQILYWIFTGIFLFFMLGSAIPDILLDPVAIKGMHEDLGYPIYFVRFIGIAKALGTVAILIPGIPKIKEWAYAGLIFDLIGATYSIIAIGAPIGNWGFMAIPILFGVLSYVYFRKKLKAS